MSESIETKRTIGHDEAKEIALRFIGGHFKNRDENGERIHARMTIPADTEHDDDILLLSYIEQNRRAQPASAGTERDVAELAARLWNELGSNVTWGEIKDQGWWRAVAAVALSALPSPYVGGGFDGWEYRP